MRRAPALASACLLAAALLARAAPSEWETLEPGLELGVFAGPKASAEATLGDGRIRILRVDPARFELRLWNASAESGPESRGGRSARAWCEKTGALAAINASMFRDDYKTSVSLMKTRTHSNNKRLSKDNAVLAFDRLAGAGALPPVQIIDRQCQPFEEISKSYGTLVQSIRLVSCDRKNAWAPAPKRWSTAAIGVDGKGRILFIHARSPWPVHDLVDALLALPIDLRRAMYVEGGPEAQLYVKAGKREIELVGSYETGFHEADDNTQAWAIPNVVAVMRRKGQ
jgi:hypothetical protein